MSKLYGYKLYGHALQATSPIMLSAEFKCPRFLPDLPGERQPMRLFAFRSYSTAVNTFDVMWSFDGPAFPGEPPLTWRHRSVDYGRNF